MVLGNFCKKSCLTPKGVTTHRLRTSAFFPNLQIYRFFGFGFFCCCDCLFLFCFALDSEHRDFQRHRINHILWNEHTVVK